MSKYGSVKYQAQNMASAIRALKTPRGGANGSKAQAREACKKEGIVPTAKEIGLRTKINSLGTDKKTVNEWKRLGVFCKKSFGINDIRTITEEMIKDYYKAELGKTNVAKTINNKATILRKFGLAVDTVSGTTGSAKKIDNAITPIQHHAAPYLIHRKRDRAIKGGVEMSKKLITNIEPKSPRSKFTAEKVRIVAELSVIATGGRSKEVRKVILGSPPPKPKSNYLSANNQLTFIGKGGQILTRAIPEDLADKIRLVAVDGIMSVSASTIGRYLHSAAERTGIKLDGSMHPFRYTFIQEKYEKFRSEGMTDEEARRAVMELVGHHRIDETDGYLK
jgi:hypothetical protein